MSSSSEAPAAAVAVANVLADGPARGDSMDGLDLNKRDNWKPMKCTDAQEVFNFFIDHMPRIKSSQDRLGFLEYQSCFYPNNMYYRNPHSAFDIVQYILACFPRQDSKYRYKALMDLVCRVELFPKQYSREQMLVLINLMRGDDNRYMVKACNLLTRHHDLDHKWIMNSETAGLILATLPDDDLRWRQVLYWLKHLDDYEGFLTIPNGESGREWIGHQFENQDQGQLVIKMIKATAIPGASQEEAYKAAMRVYEEELSKTVTDSFETSSKRPRPEPEEDGDDDPEPPKKKLRRSTRMQPTDSAKVIVD